MEIPYFFPFCHLSTKHGNVSFTKFCLEGPYCFHIFPVTFTDIIDDVYYLVKLFYIGIKLIFHDD